MHTATELEKVVSIIVLIAAICAMVGLLILIGPSKPSRPDDSYPFCEAHGIKYREIGCQWTPRETDRLEAGEGE